MKVYKIECEWDMGFKELYPSKEAAEQAIAKADWRDLQLPGQSEEECIEELMEDGLLEIREIEV